MSHPTPSPALALEMLSTSLPEGFAAFWYIGQEGYVILLNGKYILCDAFLLDMPNVRKYPPVMDARELTFIDYVFCSHGHLDHTDPKTLSVLPKVNEKARFFTPYAVAERAIELGVPRQRLTPLTQDKPVELDGLTVTTIPAAHEQLHFDDDGNAMELGYIFDGGGIRIYHSGDCCVYDGLENRLGGLDVALLPINGRDYYRLKRDCIGNMDSTEALTLARNIGAKLLIPMHYDLFPGNTVNIAQFCDLLHRDFPGQKYKIMQTGERFVYMK